LGLPLATKQQWVEWVIVAKRKKKKHDYGAYLVEQRFMEEWANLHKGRGKMHTYI